MKPGTEHETDRRPAHEAGREHARPRHRDPSGCERDTGERGADRREQERAHDSEERDRWLRGAFGAMIGYVSDERHGHRRLALHRAGQHPGRLPRLGSALRAIPRRQRSIRGRRRPPSAELCEGARRSPTALHSVAELHR
jgi:hypothetical protein